MRFRLLILGEPEDNPKPSLKKELLEHMTKKPFNIFTGTHVASYAKNNESPQYTFELSDLKIELLENLPGLPRSLSLNTTLKSIDYILYCIDVSQPIDHSAIESAFKEIYQCQPTPIILVGVNSEHSATVLNDRFQQLVFPTYLIQEKRYLIDVRDTFISTSYLVKELTNMAQQRYWDSAVQGLRNALCKRGIPLDTIAKLQIPLNTLKEGLDSHDNINIPILYTAYTNTVSTIFATDRATYPKPAILNILRVFVLHMVWVALLITLAGLAAGLALGIWTGPGAFIMCALAANTTAFMLILGASALGACDASARVYGLFHPEKSAEWETNMFLTRLKNPQYLG